MAFSLVELHWAPVGQEHLQCNYLSQFCVVCNLAEDALCPSAVVINEDTEVHWPHYLSLRTLPLTGFQVNLFADHNLLGPAAPFPISLTGDFCNLYCTTLCTKMLLETVLKDLLKSRYAATTNLPSSVKSTSGGQKTIMWVRHDRPFENPDSLHPNTFKPNTGLDTISKISNNGDHSK